MFWYVAIAIGLCLALSPLPSSAQDGAVDKDTDSDDERLEEVVVTGTRIKRRDFSSPSPIVTFERSMLDFSGQLTLEESLNRLPQLSPDFGRAANHGDGTARLNLRGLGADRTLILLNGRRVAPSGVESAVDVNNLPQALIDRVEIITGGASAVYGSDAIAGVVNFITRDDFEGFGLDSGYSITERGDAQVFDANLTYGMALPSVGGHVTVFASYYDRESLLGSERELTKQSWLDTWEGELVVFGSTSIPEGLVRSPRVDLGNGPFDQLTFNPDGSPRAFVSPDDRYDFAPINYLQTPLTRYSAGAFGTLDLGSRFEAYFEASLTRNESVNNAAPVPMQTVFTVNTDNPVLHPDTAALFEQQIAVQPGLADMLFFKRLTDLGPRIIQSDRDYTRLVAGVRGSLGGSWDVDAWLTYTDADEQGILLNGAYRSRAQQGVLVDPVSGQCYDPANGCVPLDFFGEGRLSEAGIDFLATPPIENRVRRKQTLAAVVVSGKPFATWAGPLDVALGTEWRRDDTAFRADDLLFSDDVLGYRADSPIDGTESVWELYGEALVPLIDDRESGSYLGLELGARYSSYDLAGSVETWKAGIDWRPGRNLRFRGMLQHSVRAPNNAELFTQQVEEFGPAFPAFFQDPCSASSDPVGSGNAEKCLIQGLSPDQLGVFEADEIYPATNLRGGNPNLLPESADTLTAGLVWTPGAIYGLTVSTDYFDMEIEDTIGNISPINVCFDESNTSNIFCDLATRDATGNVSRVVSLVQNRGLQAARGVDTQVRYATELPDAAALLEDGAQLRLQSIWTHMLSYKTQENPVTETYSCTGYFGYPCSAVGINSFPENRVLTTADYSSGAFSAQLTWQWIEGMLNAAPFVSADFGYPEPDLAIPDVPDYHYFDLGLGWAFESSLTLRLVVNNLFDKDPPNMADQSPAQNTDTGLYDVFGRSYFISLAWEPGR